MAATLEAEARPTTAPIDRSNSPRTSTTVAPTARMQRTEASSRIAWAFAQVRNTAGFAIEKKANAPANATRRLQRSAIARADSEAGIRRRLTAIASLCAGAGSVSRTMPLLQQ